jgi:hypothetical protein
VFYWLSTSRIVPWINAFLCIKEFCTLGKRFAPRVPLSTPLPLPLYLENYFSVCLSCLSPLAALGSCWLIDLAATYLFRPCKISLAEVLCIYCLSLNPIILPSPSSQQRPTVLYCCVPPLPSILVILALECHLRIPSPLASSLNTGYRLDLYPHLKFVVPALLSASARVYFVSLHPVRLAVLSEQYSIVLI